MARLCRLDRLNLFAIFLYLATLVSIATALPSPHNGVEKRVATEAPSERLITMGEYIDYLNAKWPDVHDRFILYTADSMDQVKNFQVTNKNYYSYDDLFNTKNVKTHKWYDFFKDGVDGDDAEAASEAMAHTATNQVRVFGAAEYETKGAASFYTNSEAKIIQESVRSGKLQAILHMAKDAVRPDQVMIKEDEHGHFSWQPGYEEGTTNASDHFGDGEPSISPKTSRSSSSSSFDSCKAAGA